jgi:hypothetical protein
MLLIFEENVILKCQAPLKGFDPLRPGTPACPEPCGFRAGMLELSNAVFKGGFHVSRILWSEGETVCLNSRPSISLSE